MKILSAFLLTLILLGCVKIYEFKISTPCETIISNNPNEPAVTTVAGSNDISGYKDGLANEALFSNLNDIAIDHDGNIYVSDQSGIRKVNTNGIVSTFINTKNILNGNKYSGNIEIDNDNNIYFIYGRHSIGKINHKGESILFAGNPGINGFSDGNGTNARFYDISDIAIDHEGNIFAIDTGNYKIRKINKFGDVSTFAGSGSPGLQDGSALSATFQYPNHITIDSENNIFLLDNTNIRKISNGIVSTLKNKFIENDYYTIDDKGNFYFTKNNIIKKMTPDGKIIDFTGTGTGCIDGSISKAKFNSPSKIIYYNGTLYILDSNGNRIRKIKI